MFNVVAIVALSLLTAAALGFGALLAIAGGVFIACADAMSDETLSTPKLVKAGMLICWIGAALFVLGGAGFCRILL